MDVNAEIASRATAVLALMQEWLVGRPALAADATAWERALAAAGPRTPLTAASPNADDVPRHLLQRASSLLTTPADDQRPVTDPALWPDFLVLARRLIGLLATVPAQEADLLHPPAPLTAAEASELTALLNELPDLLGLGRPLPLAAWRRALRRLLYRASGQRLALCTALSPRPDTELFEPLLIQALLREPDARQLVRAATATDPVPLRQQAVSRLLLAPELLATCLDAAGLAVPFAHVLGRELEEIARRRAHLLTGPEPVAKLAGPASPDPLRRPFGPGKGPFALAGEANLLGLAFSGGGIRSATFGLGVLQALARHGWLPRVDYLSTVSGGGYLGSWLVALVQRLGSVHAAQRQLDPTLSPNPRAEDNRPVRWLRSYSNYLTPEASAFSTDTWTLVTTWLRNALLNQIILVLFLGAVLLLPHFLLARWQWWGDQHPQGALGAALLLLALVAGLAGWQQRWYDRPAGEAPPKIPGWLRWLPVPGILPALLLAAGWHLAAYAFYRPPGPADGATWFWWMAGVLSGWLLVVAALGRYHLCFRWKNPAPWVAWGVIVLLSALAALAGAALLLALVRYLPHFAGPADQRMSAPHSVVAGVMVFGPALAVEVLGLVLTGRMALLGAAFADERREWWGRLGASVHLAVLGWVLLAGASLLLPHLLDLLPVPAGFWPTTTAAWVALVGAGVKLAQGAGAPAQPSAGPQTVPARATDAVTRLVPYLFLVGLLLLLVVGLRRLLPLAGRWAGALGFGHSDFDGACPGWVAQLALMLALGGLSWLLAWRVGVNEFSLHHFYKNRLLRAYLGASRPRDERQANPFTDFDTADDLRLCQLRHQPLPDADGHRPPPYHGPLPLLNTALNVTRGGELAHQNRRAEAFVFSPLYAGFDFARLVPVQRPDGRYAEYGYRPTHAYAYPAPAATAAQADADTLPPSVAGGVHVGTVMAISGAAANPNMGYHSSPVTAFLLTLFNVRLGWWMGNPRRATWQSANPRTGLGYLLKDLFGRASPTDDYVCLSDGGHFDNLGLYELVRRRCRYIIVCDGEEDASRRFEGLANAIRRCRVDFGVEIDIDLTALRQRDAHGHTAAHAALGTITYPDQPTPGTGGAGGPAPTGQLLYLKATLTGHEPEDVLEYAHQNSTFPHQSTGDQFFSEDQFESYRQLGYFAASHLFPTAAPHQPLPDPAPLFDAGRLKQLYPIK